MSSASSSSSVSFLVFIVSLSRTCCLFVQCELGCRGRGDRGRGSCWLFESAANEVTFHSIPFRAVFRRGGPGRVAREIVVVSVGSVWLYAGVEVAFSSLGRSSLFPVPYC